MKITIIDPFLLDCSGHNYNLVMTIAEALEKNNMNFIILANYKADESCLRIKNSYPCLISVTDKAFKITYSIGNFLSLCFAIKSLMVRLNKAILNNPNFRIGYKDIFYFPTPYILELLALGLFLLQKRKIFIENNCVFFLGLNFAYIRKSFFSTLLFSLMYKVVCNIIIKLSGVRVIYFSAGKELKDDYQKLLKRKVEIIPEPINMLYTEENDKKIFNEENKMVVSYIGAARYNKGFDILVKMIEHLLDDKEMMRKTLFVIQIDVQEKSQTKSESEKIWLAVRKLKDIATTFKNIKLIYGTLALKEYYKNLSDSNIVIFPHRDAFKRAHSKTFIETIVAKKVPVVSDNTAAADYLKGAKLDGLIFKEGDVSDLINVLRHTIDNYQEYKQKIETLSKEWTEFYSEDNFITTLVRLAE